MLPGLSRDECRRRARLALATLEGITVFAAVDEQQKRRPALSRSYVVRMLMATVGTKPA